MPDPNVPMCEKLSQYSTEIRAIREFMDWLEVEKDLGLETFTRTEDLIMEFYEIDQNELEKERRQLLNNLRARQ